jgi:hypothetical protein
MIYGLVIVTSLGATTLLNTYPTHLDCMKEQSFMSVGPNSQAQCWPSKSQQELQKRIDEINNTISKVRIIQQ